MTGSHSDTQPTGPTAATMNSVWDRLRESMDRLRSIDRQASGPDALARKLAGRAELLRGRISPVETEASIDFLSFNCGREQYGIVLDDILEVQALDHFTVVPKTPPFLPGVTHWRGAVLALLDLGRLFEIPVAGLVDAHVCIVVEAAGRRMGIVAQEIEELCRVPAGRLPPAPDFSAEVPAEWIVGVHEQQRLILNMRAIFHDDRLVDWK